MLKLLLVFVVLCSVQSVSAVYTRFEISQYSTSGYSASAMHVADSCCENGYCMCGSTPSVTITGWLQGDLNSGVLELTSGVITRATGGDVVVTGGTIGGTGVTWNIETEEHGTFYFSSSNEGNLALPNTFIDQGTDDYVMILWGQNWENGGRPETNLGPWGLDIYATMVDCTEAAIDLSLWTNEPASADNWNVAGTVAHQTTNTGYPTFLVGDLPSCGYSMQVSVTTPGVDDDYMGFVLGYSFGDNTNPQAEYILVDWKQDTQTYNEQTGIVGLAVSRVTGAANWDDFWQHSGVVTEIARGIQSGNVGWVDSTTHVFEFGMTETTLYVEVDGVLEIYLTGQSFPCSSGHFGFYSLSQEDVSFSADAVSCYSGPGGCETFELDLGSWSAEGGENTATDWTYVNTEQTVVRQIPNTKYPTFYVSDFQACAKEMTVEIFVDNSWDNDFVGVALGYNEGDATNDNANYILIDWKQENQTDANAFGREGLSVSRVSGAANSNCGSSGHGLCDFWDHEGVIEEIAFGDTLKNEGWETSTSHTLKFGMTSTELSVFVDDVLEIYLNAADVGTFPCGGGFAFYSFSQSEVHFNVLDTVCYDPPTPACYSWEVAFDGEAAYKCTKSGCFSQSYGSDSWIVIPDVSDLEHVGGGINTAGETDGYAYSTAGLSYGDAFWPWCCTCE